MKPTEDYLTKHEFLEYMDQFKADFKTELKAELLPELRIMIIQIVGDVVGEIVGDAMQIISKQFADLQLALEKSDYRLSVTVNQVDSHEVRLRRLEA